MSAEGVGLDLVSRTFKVLTDDGMVAGAAFPVMAGRVVTCSHVVARARSGDGGPVVLQAAGAPHARISAQLDLESAERGSAADVVFLDMDTNLVERVSPLELGASADVLGQPVTTFGFPEGSPGGRYGYGRAGNFVEQDGRRLLQLTAANEPSLGYSGGPVIDANGLVVGMLTAIAAVDEHGRGATTAYATPIETLRSIDDRLAVSEICPFKGLDAFGERDALWFCGRDAAKQRVSRALARRPPVIVLTGPSGSGKTSLLHAWMVPALAANAVTGSERWDVVCGTAAEDLVRQLARAGLQFGGGRSLSSAIQEHLGTADSSVAARRLVLVVDQFEQLLVEPLPVGASSMLEQLTQVSQQDLAITLVVVLRDDFYGRMRSVVPELLSHPGAEIVPVPAVLGAAELAHIIQGPAQTVNLTFEPGLVDRLVESCMRDVPAVAAAGDTAATAVLPMLELTLTALWEHRAPGGRLTHAALDHVGGIAGAIAGRCDDVFNQLTADQQPVARRVLTALVRRGDASAGIPAVRRRRLVADLTRADTAHGVAEDRDVRDVVEVLTESRLLTAGRDNDEPVVELVHDTLLQHWPGLQALLADQEQFLRWLDSVEGQHEQWRATEPRDGGLLLTGTRLSEAMGWLETSPQQLSASLTRYLRASAAAERRRITRERRVAVLLAGLLAGAIALSVVAWAENRTAQQERRTAQSRALALAAQQALARDPDLAHLLAVESAYAAATPETTSTIQQLLATPLREQTRLSGRSGSGGLTSVAISPDGTQVATVRGELERLVLVRHDPRTGRAVGPAQKMAWTSDDPATVSYSPGGARIVVAESTSNERGAEQVHLGLWGSDDGAPVADGLPLDGLLSDIVFSPRGSRFAVATMIRDVTVDGSNISYNGVLSSDVHVYQTSSGRRVGRALRVRGELSSLAFSPDGAHLATGAGTLDELAHGERIDPDMDASVQLWDVSTGAKVDEMQVSADYVADVAFNPDGDEIAVAAGHVSARGRLERGQLRVWRPGAGDDGRRLLRADQVSQIRYSGDGTMLVAVTGSASSPWSVSNGRVHVLSATTGTPVVNPLAHDDAVSHVAFSPVTGELLTVSTPPLNRGVDPDSTLTRWDLATGRQIGTPVTHGGEITGLMASPDGQHVMTVGAELTPDGAPATLRVWDAVTMKPVGEPVQYGTELTSTAISPDGGIAISGDDGAAAVWRLDISRPLGYATPLSTLPMDLLASQGTTSQAAYAPAGNTLATVNVIGSEDGLVTKSYIRMWNATTNLLLTDVIIEDGTVPYVVFSPDGSLVATATLTLQHREESGSTEVTSGAVKLWDAATGRQVGPTLHHDGEVSAIVFDHAGDRFATVTTHYVTEDGGTAIDRSIVRIWDTVSGQQIGDPLELSGEIVRPTFSMDDRRLAVASSDPRGDRSTVELLTVFPRVHRAGTIRQDGSVQALAFDDQGAGISTVAYVDDTVVVQQWDLTTRQRRGTAQVFDGYGVTIAAGGWDYGRVVALVDAPDGAGRPEVRFMDIVTGRRFPRLLDHPESIRAAAFSPDGRTAVTVTDVSPGGVIEGGELRFWDLATGLQAGDAMTIDGFVSALSYRADSAEVATVSEDGSTDQLLQRWRVPAGWIGATCERAHRNLTQAEWARYGALGSYRRTCDRYPAGRDQQEVGDLHVTEDDIDDFAQP